MKLRILSLGAGVQSSALAMLIEQGKVPMVDAAIFADVVAIVTGKQITYLHHN